VSLDRDYHGIDPEDVRITNTDDDAPAARGHNANIARVAGRNTLKYRAHLSSRAIGPVSANAAITDVAISQIGATLPVVDQRTAEPLRAGRLLRRDAADTEAFGPRRRSIDSRMARTGPYSLRPALAAQLRLWLHRAKASSGELELALGEIAAEISSAAADADFKETVFRKWI
jgi:hypothetical protein